MHLQVMSPSRIELETEAERISAESRAGNFTLLEHHVDMVAALVPGLLSYSGADGREGFLAVDGGIALKVGPDVTISTDHAVRGELGDLERTVEESFKRISRKQQQTRAALEKMQADFVRQFIELQVRGEA
jgi:F-type H+-transporting ATPase subunit epsilon